MKKIIFIWSLLFITGSYTYSQNTFVNHISYGVPVSNNQIWQIKQKPDGNYVALFRFRSDSSQDLDFGFYTLNSAGILIDTIIYSRPGTDYTQDFIIDADGSYKICGVQRNIDPLTDSRHLFYSINPSDSNLNTYTLYPNPLGNSGGYKIIKDKSNFTIFGSKDTEFKSTDMNLFRVNGNGGVLKDSLYGGAEADVTYSGIKTNDEGYLLVGTSFSYSPREIETFIVKTDSNGKKLWQLDIPIAEDPESRCRSLASSVIQATNGNYYITANSDGGCEPGDQYFITYGLLICVDSNGNLLWSHKEFFSFPLPHFYYDQLYSFIFQTLDGNIVCVGGISQTATNNIGWFQAEVLITKYDLNGNLIWKRFIGDGEFNENVYCASQTSDGGIVVGGRYENTYFPDNGVYSFIMKTDACGCLVPGCDPNCIALGIANDPSTTPFVLYPNPTNSVLFLQSEVPIVGYQIYSMLGELVKQGQPIDNSISVVDLPTAVYTLQVITEEGNSVFKKFVKY